MSRRRIPSRIPNGGEDSTSGSPSAAANSFPHTGAQVGVESLDANLRSPAGFRFWEVRPAHSPNLGMRYQGSETGTAFGVGCLQGGKPRFGVTGTGTL